MNEAPAGGAQEALAAAKAHDWVPAARVHWQEASAAFLRAFAFFR